MSSRADWRRVYDFWFPIDLSQAEIGEHWRMLLWWMRGGANAELGPFAPLVGEATAGAAVFWRGTRLTYTQVVRSEEFYGQRGTQTFGSISLSFRF